MTAVYFNNCKKHIYSYTLLGNMTEFLNVKASAATAAVLWSIKTTSEKL